MNSKLRTSNDFSEMIEAFQKAELTITKEYLDVINKLEITELPLEIKELDLGDYVRVFKVNQLVYNQNENGLEKMISVLNSNFLSESSFITIIVGNENGTDYYMGVANKTPLDVTSQITTLEGTFTGNFIGSNIEILKNDKMKELNRVVFECENIQKYVSSVSCVSSIRLKENDDIEKYVQGLEKLADSMNGKTYTAVLIADPVRKLEVSQIRRGYEELHTQLAPFQKYQVSINESNTKNITRGLTKGITETTGSSISSTVGTTESIGTSDSSSESEGTSRKKTSGAVVSGIGAASSMLGTVTGLMGAGALGAGTAAAAGAGTAAFIAVNAVPIIIGAGLVTVATTVLGDIIGTENKTSTMTTGNTNNSSTTENKTDQVNKSTSDSEQNSESFSDGDTKGKSLQLNYENRSVKSLLEKIDKQIDRLEICEDYGTYRFGAYFISNDTSVCKQASVTYNGLLKGEDSSVETSAINMWTDQEKCKELLGYISKYYHPNFQLQLPSNKMMQVTATTIVNSKELATQIMLPKKSIKGLAVIEKPEFGRNIKRYDKDARVLNLGDLYHMGKAEDCVSGGVPVKLDVDSLTMHTFITGSTGSGKTNAIYSILEKLIDMDVKGKDEKIKFLVIEPAKGEYKDKFGHYPNVNVYGTNFKKTPLLRINPFSFPEDVHVLEHIDRLAEIFNVCWPMYAAMPAILKDAIERAYQVAGWDLDISETKYTSSNGMKLYPTFVDLMQQINVVVEDSKYSDNTKGDYSGALYTRVKTLTNGLYGNIFTVDELSNEKLFDENTIVDLSRVGSSDTKSLIMGILVLKLQEYRMSSKKENNQGLKHVTVLEEAHNLLKKTSTEQSGESSNLLGKSVEMLANAIAEMRTYGEGFIITDQSPGLLDMSVIRNTNTKIILRLPDYSDRELVGRAASLNEDQIAEISKLDTGVAAVYQNNWLEPILCHIDRCRGDEKEYSGYELKKNGNRTNELIDYLIKSAGKRNIISCEFVDNFEENIYNMRLTAEVKTLLIKYYNEKDINRIITLRNELIIQLFNSEKAIRKSEYASDNIKKWTECMLENLEPKMNHLSVINQNKIIATILNNIDIENKWKTKDILVRFSSDIIDWGR